MQLMLLGLAVLFLAFSNGANDNFKGVATLFGNRRLGFRPALCWATATTFLGSAAALVIGHELVRTFSGRGLVSDALVGDPTFVTAVAVAAAGTVALATRLGMPISTTHALIGGLVGAGLTAEGTSVRLGALGTSAALPLLFSPIAALVLTFALYRVFRRARVVLGVREESCVCVASSTSPLAAVADGRLLARAWRSPVIAHRSGCTPRLDGRLAGIDAQRALDLAHFSTSGIVGFARGLNDTPKIVALLAVAGAVAPSASVLAVGIMIALGGLLAARRVAETLSHGITPMNDGQGFSASLVTAGLVLLASRFGLPVSTTHVSVGALFGIGAATREARRAAIAAIVTAWLVTLPVSAGLAAAAFAALHGA